MIISVDDKYLLVKNNHGLGLLQLPIRVYEIDDIKKVEIIHEKINAIIDSYPKRNWLDWRLLVPTKKLILFIKHLNLREEKIVVIAVMFLMI